MGQKQPLVLSGAQLQQLQASDYASIGIPFFMHKNRILNGDFNIWQRGGSLNTLTTTGTYYPDQWIYYFNGSTPSINVQQLAFALGQTAVPDNPKYYCECSVSLAASGQTYLQMAQNIEGVQTFQGQTVTLSLWAKADTNARQLGANFQQLFGTGGSPSAGVGYVGALQTLSTSWAKYTWNQTLTSISGKTLGTNGNDCLQLILVLPVNTGFTIDIAHVQLEQGPNATQFEYRNIEHELLMCQRYFEAITAGSAFGPLAIGGWVGQSGPSTYLGEVFASFISKRTIPTITFPDPVGNYYLNASVGGNTVGSISAVGGGSTTKWQLSCQTTPALTSASNGQACALQCNNTTARLWASAEL